MKEQKQIRKIGDLLSYQEILNIGLPYPEKFFNISLASLELLGKNDEDNYYIADYIFSNVKNDFMTNFPDYPGDFEKPLLWFRVTSKDQYNNILKLSFLNYCGVLLTDEKISFLSVSNDSFFDYFKVVDIIDPEQQKERIKEYFRNKRDSIKRVRDSGSVVHLKLQGNLSGVEVCTKEIKLLNWHIRNMDRLYDYFNKNLDPNLLSVIDKDTFLAFYIFSTQHLMIDSDIENYSVDQLKKYITPTENYMILIDYLKSITNRNYKVSFDTILVIKDNDKPINLLKNIDNLQLYHVDFSDIETTLIDFYNNHPEFKNRDDKVTSYEELLKNMAVNAWNKIRSEKFKKNIQLNWEIIPNKEFKDNFSNMSGRVVRSIPNRKNTDAKLKKAYDILEEKFDFFGTTDFVTSFHGKNHFEGYMGFLYPNGKVVFEKFYRTTKKNPNLMIPVVDEAIYVMDYKNFREMSQYTKAEIINFIHDFNNTDIMRIYHSPTWKEKVNRVIENRSYTEDDLAFIETLTNELMSEQSKVLGKRYE